MVPQSPLCANSQDVFRQVEDILMDPSAIEIVGKEFETQLLQEFEDPPYVPSAMEEDSVGFESESLVTNAI